ncbi:MAG: glycosyltransferase [Gemmataceae bacterium]|nr:glycosyltransferase [Gemmataceae bacterium]
MLGIFAKQPIVGTVKTRLAEGTSAEWACRVAEALLVDTLDRFTQVDVHRAVVFAPLSATTFFTSLCGIRYELIAQSGGDLGERLQHFFTLSRQRGHSRIVAIGSDSPTLPMEYVRSAFDLLADHDVVLGPAFDGGYYLIGCNHHDLPIFTNIAWSTSRVLEQTVERVRAASARLALLPPWYDVDTYDDWRMLRGHVRAMRASGVEPGVANIERLIECE